jgi:O-antigen ligase
MKNNIIEKFKFGSTVYSEILNVLFVVYALLLPFSNAFSTHTGPYLLLLFWVMEGDFGRKLAKIRSEKAVWFLLLFFFINLLSLLWTTDIKEGMYILKFYFAITVVFVTFYTSMKERYVLPVIFAFLVAMFISEIVSYGVFLEWWTTKHSSPSMPTPFMHHVPYSIFLVVTIFLLLGQILNKKISLSLRIFEAIFLLSATANLFINGGRTGQLAFIVGLFVFVWSYFGTKLKYLFVTVLILSSLFFAAYRFSPVFHNRVHLAISDIQKIQNNNLNSSWGSRIAMKIVSFDILKQQLLIGVGIGDTREVYREALNQPEFKKYSFTRNVHHVHDQYLQIMLETGLLGLIPFILFIWLLFTAKYKNPLPKSTLLAILTVFIFSFSADVPLRNYLSGLFAFATAFLLLRSQEDISETQEIPKEATI